MHGGAAGVIFGVLAITADFLGPVMLLTERQICSQLWHWAHWRGQDTGSKLF